MANSASFKILDGYQLSTTDGTHFNTPWINVNTTPFFSISLVITGGTVAGTATLQQSNDTASTAAVVYPSTAVPQTPFGTPVDAANVPSGTGQQTIVLTTSGVGVVANQYNAGFRWVRLVYVATSSNTTGVVSCFMHKKDNL